MNTYKTHDVNFTTARQTIIVKHKTAASTNTTHAY